MPVWWQLVGSKDGTEPCFRNNEIQYGSISLIAYPIDHAYTFIAMPRLIFFCFVTKEK